MSTFQEGDVVRLKGGGPHMDVIATVYDYPFERGVAPAVYCAWDDNHFRFEQMFHPHALEPVLPARPLYERRRYPR